MGARIKEIKGISAQQPAQAPTYEERALEYFTRHPERGLDEQAQAYFRKSEAAVEALGGKTPEFSIPKHPALKPAAFKFNKEQASRYLERNSDDNIRYLGRLMKIPGADSADMGKLRGEVLRRYTDLEDVLGIKRATIHNLATELGGATGGRKYATPFEMIYRKRDGSLRRMVAATNAPPSATPKTVEKIWSEIDDKALTLEQVRDVAKRYLPSGRRVSKKRLREIDTMDMPELAQYLWGVQKAAFKKTGMGFNPKSYGLRVVWDTDKALWRMIDLDFVMSAKGLGQEAISFATPSFLEPITGTAAYKLGKGIKKVATVPQRIGERVQGAAETGMEAVGLGGVAPGRALRVGAGLGALTGALSPGTAAAIFTPDVAAYLGRKLMRDPKWVGSRVVNALTARVKKEGSERLGVYLYLMAKQNPELRQWIQENIGGDSAVQE
jgi:hypothetical protein